MRILKPNSAAYIVNIPATVQVLKGLGLPAKRLFSRVKYYQHIEFLSS